jgi:hypothetical protein
MKIILTVRATVDDILFTVAITDMQSKIQICQKVISVCP